MFGKLCFYSVLISIDFRHSSIFICYICLPLLSVNVQKTVFYSVIISIDFRHSSFFLLYLFTSNSKERLYQLVLKKTESKAIFRGSQVNTKKKKFVASTKRFVNIGSTNHNGYIDGFTCYGDHSNCCRNSYCSCNSENRHHNNSGLLISTKRAFKGTK